MVWRAEIVLSQVSDDPLPLFPSPFEKFLTISQFWRAQRGEGGPTALSYIGSEVAADIFRSQRERTPYLDSRTKVCQKKKSMPRMNLTQF